MPDIDNKLEEILMRKHFSAHKSFILLGNLIWSYRSAKMMSYRFANNLWLDKLKTQLQKFSRKTPFIEPYIDRIIFYSLHSFADSYCMHEKNNQY